MTKIEWTKIGYHTDQDHFSVIFLSFIAKKENLATV